MSCVHCTLLRHNEHQFFLYERREKKKAKKLRTEGAVEAMVPDTISGERIWNEIGEIEAGISQWVVEEAASDKRW